MPSRYHVFPILAVVIVACGGDTGRTADIQGQIEDSAGVRIVTYGATPATVAPFHLAAEPRYRHGASPGHYTFHQVEAGRLFPDGSAVVADWFGEVVVLSSDGTTHEVLARVGEGPGEVISPYSLFVLGQDSVLVPDDRLSRLTLFVRDSVALIMSLPRVYHIGVAGIGSSGKLLTWNRYPYRSWIDLEEEWLAGHMALFDTETGVLDTVASYDHFPRETLDRLSPIRALGEVTVATGRFVYTRSDRPEITWRLPEGTVDQIVRWRAEPTLLTEELLEPVEAYQRLVTLMNNRGVPMSRIEELVQNSMSSRYAMIGQPLPLFGAPFADADGNVWLPTYRMAHPKEGSPYTVVSPDGEWLGRVETPPRFRILDVNGGLVLGVLRDDETDVDTVVVYEVTLIPDGAVGRSS